jgi:uncharacterized protein YegJ (DUF2314 family)
MKRLLFLLLMIVCTESFGQTKVDKNVKYQSVELKKDDKEFLRLKDVAQKHMSEFLALLKKHGADYENYRFVVKSDFVEGTDHEHMWSQIMGYSNNIFKAYLSIRLSNLKTSKTAIKLQLKRQALKIGRCLKITRG